MKSICFSILLMLICWGCGSNNDVADKTDKLIKKDSLEDVFISQLQTEIKYRDSMDKETIKATFAAGYRQGVSTGINNYNLSIHQLKHIASLDSFKFARFVDISFPKK